MNKKIKILIADDMESLRNSYAKKLESFKNLEVVSLCKNGYEAISNTVKHKPDVILMDIEMESKYSGLLVTQQIINTFPNLKIIILTVSEDDESIFSAFQAGAYNYILKNCTTKELVKAIEDAYYDRSVFDAKISKKIRKEFQRIKNNENILLSTISLIQLLTDSERNIIYHLYLGLTQPELCDKLCIEKSTLKTHTRNIRKKLNLRTMSEVIKTLEQSGYFYYYEKLKNTNNIT